MLNDNVVRGREWRRLVGEFFAARLGGDEAAWSLANVPAFERAWSRYLALPADHTDIEGFYRDSDREWLGTMCAHAGVPPPEGDVDALLREAVAFINERARAAHDDAVPAVRALVDRGAVLHMASGTRSTDLDALLRGMGIRQHFGLLFGPDLAGRWKKGPAYYEAVARITGAEPRRSVVVDDSTEALDWAAEVGFATVHVARDGRRGERHPTVTRLTELAGAIPA